MNPGIRFFQAAFHTIDRDDVRQGMKVITEVSNDLHFSIILIIQRLQEMDLDGDRADGVGVKGFEGVYQSDGYNGASGFASIFLIQASLSSKSLYACSFTFV